MNRQNDVRVMFRVPAFIKAITNLLQRGPSSDLDLNNLINLLMRAALQQKMCRQEIRDVDYVKRVLLHCSSNRMQ